MSGEVHPLVCHGEVPGSAPGKHGAFRGHGHEQEKIDENRDDRVEPAHSFP